MARFFERIAHQLIFLQKSVERIPGPGEKQIYRKRGKEEERNEEKEDIKKIGKEIERKMEKRRRMTE